MWLLSSGRRQVVNYINQGAIPEENISKALIVAKVIPNGAGWRKFVDYILLIIGSLSIAFAALFFVAYNWADLGRFAKFAMLEVLLLAAIACYLKFDYESLTGKLSLLIATIFLGVLLALYGQTYQTGADPWELFFNWALLVLPWALISRFAPIWILWVVLINLSIVLYHQAFRGLFWLGIGADNGILWLVFIFNTSVLAIWEILSSRLSWLSARWSARLLATASGVCATWLSLFAIFEYKQGSVVNVVVWLAWLAVLYWVYRRIKPDLFVLAGACLSTTVVVTGFLAKQILRDFEAVGFLLLSVCVIGMGAAAAVWLKRVNREISS
jgi:uncharacterized membrane protein